MTSLQNLARDVDGIPVVASAADRAVSYANPPVNFRVHNLTTHNIERWDGSTWVTDFSGTVVGVLTVSRLIGNGTAHVAGDYTLSAGWGNTATVSTVAARDTGGRVSITCGGSGIAANPTITLTYKDGTWTTIPEPVSTRGDVNAPTQADFVCTTPAAATAIFTFTGAPVAGTVYVMAFDTIGE